MRVEKEADSFLLTRSRSWSWIRRTEELGSKSQQNRYNILVAEINIIITGVGGEKENQKDTERALFLLDFVVP